MTKPANPDPAEAISHSSSAAADEAGQPSGVVAAEVPEMPPAADKPMAEDSAPVESEPTGDGAPHGSTAPVLPSPRAKTSTADGLPSTVTRKVGELESASGAGGTKTDQQRPAGRPSGYPSSSGPGPATASSRYGQSVAQPFNVPSRGVGQDFSGPTVRIGGRVQSEQASAQPPLSTRVRPTRIPRRTSLQLRYLEPWSVLKVSLVLSVAGFLAWMVAVGVLYNVLGSMGVWDQLNGTYSDLTSVRNPETGQDLITAGGVFGVALVIGLVNIVLITAMCTVGAFIYNASADLAGGIEVTLSERD